jgi:hypothetical protein
MIGLDKDEFERLSEVFQEAWDSYIRDKCSSGREPKLRGRACYFGDKALSNSEGYF